MHILLASLVVAAGAAVAAPVAHADRPSSARSSLAGPVTIDVEVTETEKKSSQKVIVTLSLAEDGRCATASSHAGDVGYRIEVCRSGGDAAAPVLSFDVDRAETSKNGATRRQLTVSSRLHAGKRAIVGRIARGDGATEIAATVQ
jgi:hypothetical protein